MEVNENNSESKLRDEIQKNNEYLTCDILKKRFSSLIIECFNTNNTALKRVTSPERSENGDIVFISQNKYLDDALKQKASLIVISPQMKELLLASNFKGAVIISNNTENLKAQILKSFFEHSPKSLFKNSTLQSTSHLYKNSEIHPTAVISSSAKIGNNTWIGPYVVIGDNSVIEDNTFIGAHTVIEENCIIGKQCRIAAHVFISYGSIIGTNCVIGSNTSIGSEGFGYTPNQEGIWESIPQIGCVILEDFVEIGANCAIDRAALTETRIGAHTKIDNLCHIAHNCKIGPHGLITAGFMVAGSTTIGSHFKTGGVTKVTGHVKIADHVTLSGGSTVTGSIDKSGEYGGHPLQSLRDHLKTTATFVHLVKMRKDIHHILKNLQNLVNHPSLKGRA